MSPIQIILCILGLAIICISFFLSDRNADKKSVNQMKTALLESNLLDDEFRNRLYEEFRTKLAAQLDKMEQECIETTEGKLSEVANEKIMSIDEFFEQLLDKVSKNHSEVVFMYQMLEEKETSLKEFVEQIEKKKLELQKQLHQSMSEQVAYVSQKEKKTVQPKSALASAGVQIESIDSLVGSTSRTDTVIPKKTAKKAQQEGNLVQNQELTSKSASVVPSQTQTHVLEAMVEKHNRRHKVQTNKDINQPTTYQVPGKEQPAVAVDTIAINGFSENSNEQILALHQQGKSVVEISKALGLGQGEVKLVLDLYKGSK